jgi:hypothetical protein
METGQEIIPEADRRRGQRRLVGLGISGSFNGNLIGQTTSLFLLALGGGPFHIGLLATLSSLNQAVNLPAVLLMRRWGKVALMVRVRVLATTGAIALVVLAFVGTPGPGMVWLAIAFIGVRTLFMNVGNVAWWPLVRDNTAGSSMPAFLARMRIGQRAGELVLPLAIGWHLGTHPEPRQFGWLYALAIISTLAGALFVRGVCERREAAAAEGLLDRVRALARITSIRRYFMFALARNLVFTSMVPFFVVALTERGMPIIHFVWMASVVALGQLLTLYAWGRLVETYESRAVLTFSLLGCAVLGLFWLILPTGVTALTLAAAGFYLAWGTLEGGLSMGLTQAMMISVPEQNQGEGFSLIAYASAMGGAAGGLLGGVTFDWANRLPDGHLIEPEIVYLVLAHAAIGIVYLLLRKTEGYAQQASLTELLGKLMLRRTR